MRAQLRSVQPISRIAACLLLILAIIGCSRSGSPVTPTDTAAGGPDVQTGVRDDSAYAMSWGVWDVSMESPGSFEIVPLRAAQYTLNVAYFLQPPAGKTSNMNVTIVDDHSLFTTGRVVIDVVLKHPFPAYSEYAGFDVLGVFIHNGQRIARHSSAVRYASPGTDAILINADGYTRWMNPVEFTAPGLGGYLEGALGTKKIHWTATINPYKYFCDDLSATESIADHYSSSQMVNNRGVFRAGRTNTRRYDLKFPMSGGYPQVKFQYAVVASWLEPNHVPPTSVPGDFPPGANITEPFFLRMETDGTTAYWNSPTDKGGDLLLTLEVFDQGARLSPGNVETQISKIIVESPSGFILGSNNMLTFGSADWSTSPGSTTLSQRFVLDCGAVDPNGPSPKDNPVLVAVESATGSYDTGVGTPHPTGRPNLYQVLEVPLSGWTPEIPGNVMNFNASDGDTGLGNHQVKLTWDPASNADEYTIERYNYNTSPKTWQWAHLYTAPGGSTSYIDTNARYSGTRDTIDYRMRAENGLGSSPSWSTDDGYPKKRRVGIAFWCAADNSSGANAVVPWSRAVADYTDLQTFWNDFGFDYIMENSGSFFWMTNINYRNLTGTEGESMHAEFGKVSHPNSINVYYVATSDGDPAAAYCSSVCPGTDHTTKNIFIVLCQDARTPPGCPQGDPIVLAHECGHGLTRFWDMYLLVTTCAADNTWCTGPPPFIPPLYCDEDADYPLNLMYFSYCGSTPPEYSLTTGQFIEANSWVRDHETAYPVP